MTERQVNGAPDREADTLDARGSTVPGHGDDAGVGPDPSSPGAAGSVPDDPDDGASAIEDVEAALENARVELDRAQDRYVRLAAEFDNYRKRTDREKLEMYARAQADLVTRMLDAVDDLERVADFDESTPSKALLEGVRLVEKKLLAAFEAVGLRRLDAAGKPFDPASMEAVATVPADSPDDDDLVADVFQAGYLFGDLLVRPARVRVRKYED